VTDSFPSITLTEWKTKTCPNLSLSIEDRQLVDDLKNRATGRLDVNELREGIQIRAYSWVGVIRFQNFDVRIIPKLAGGNASLVEMLTLTGGLNTLRRNSGKRNLEVNESAHLLDLIALLFAKACEKIVDGGLLHDYVERESDLPVLRGRLLTGQQIRQFHGRVDRLVCRYDDHLTDIIENQILAAALTICRFRVNDPVVRLQIHRLHTIFAAVCSTKKLTDLASLRTRIHYNRMNEHYREAHELAWLLFDSMGINDLLAIGQTRSFAFLLDMNRLFELFAARFINHALQDKLYQIDDQKRDRSIIWDLMQERPYTHIIPDILIKLDNDHYLTIDAKYKLYDEKKLSTADIYQSFFYAYAYNDQGKQKPAALLLYPSSKQHERAGYLQIRGQNKEVKAHLRAISISIPEAISEINNDTLGPMSQVLSEAIEEFVH